MLSNDDKKLFELVAKQAKHKEKFPQEKPVTVEEKYERQFQAQENVKALMKKWGPVLEKLPDDNP